MTADVSRKRRNKRSAEGLSPSAAWSNAWANYGQTTVVMRTLPLTSIGHANPERQPSLVTAESPRWMSVKRLAQEYKDIITEAALRHLIWQAEAYARYPKSGLKSNGFLPVIVRPPNQRKVLLDRIEFEKWLTSDQAGGSVQAPSRG